MNALVELMKRAKEKMIVKTVFGEEVYCFTWNLPASLSAIQEFELSNNCILPKEYKEFLMCSNGAIIFKSENEDDGYKLLSIEEMEEITKEMKEDGYLIPDKFYCFLQCLFSNDVLLLNLQNNKCLIMDGDVGYPFDKWEYIGKNINTFIIRLCQSNGAMFWRWK